MPFVAALVPEVDLEGRPRRRRRTARAARPRGVTPVRVDVVSIFPEYLAPLDLSLIGKARRDGILDVRVHDLRDFAHDRHRTVDDSPFGGGAGMVMKPEPWAEALDAVVASGPAGEAGGAAPRSCPGPGGVPFSQALARSLADEPWLAFACGRYEGLDERVYEHAADRMPVTVVSLGDYVLNGGEVAVLAMVEAVGRLLPGVVGNAESLVEESHEDGLLEYPVYTRPASWDDAGTVREVPAVLLSGDHGAIAAWRHQQRLERTAARRPDLLPVSATRGGAGRPRRAGGHARRCRRAARAAAGLLGARGAGGPGPLGRAAAGGGARRRRAPGWGSGRRMPCACGPPRAHRGGWSPRCGAACIRTTPRAGRWAG